MRIPPIALLLLVLSCNRQRDLQSPVAAVHHDANTMTTLIVDTLTACNLDVTTISFDTTLGSPVDAKGVGDSLEYEWAPRPVLRTRLQAADSTVYEIEYSQGPSCDPYFSVNRAGLLNQKHLGGGIGTAISIPGDGCIYISGIADDYFDRHRKFVVRGDTLVEMMQPSYYVGLASTANDTVRLYREPALVRLVATVLPKDSLIVVLSHADHTYLIRDRHGILGWATIRRPAGRACAGCVRVLSKSSHHITVEEQHTGMSK
jgi:hypothetical protein